MWVFCTVMLLPIRLIWNLRMSRSRKVSIGALFGMAWACIAVSIIRVIELGNNWGKGTPEPTWLALWGTIEAAVGKYPSHPSHPSLEVQYRGRTRTRTPNTIRCHLLSANQIISRNNRLLPRPLPPHQSPCLQIPTLLPLRLLRLPNAHRQRGLREPIQAPRPRHEFLADISTGGAAQCLPRE